MNERVRRDSRWKARLLPGAIRIICAPGARAGCGPDRGTKAGNPRKHLPNSGEYRGEGAHLKHPAYRKHLCIEYGIFGVSSEVGVRRGRRWKAGPTSGPIRPSARPGRAPGGDGRAARGADLRAGMRAGESRKFPTPPPRPPSGKY
eukprot:gene24117-biopygen1326